MCRELKSQRKPFQHQILQRTALSLEWQCVLENLITYQQFNFMIVALPTLIVTCENGDDRVIMMIVIQNFKLWWWRGGASSVCIWRSAAVFPQDLLSPSLISTTANFDVDTWWWWGWIWASTKCVNTSDVVQWWWQNERPCYDNNLDPKLCSFCPHNGVDSGSQSSQACWRVKSSPVKWLSNVQPLPQPLPQPTFGPLLLTTNSMLFMHLHDKQCMLPKGNS